MKKLHDGPLLDVDVLPSPRGIGIVSVIVQYDALRPKKNGANHNRRFYRCANANDEQCSFFLWVDDEPAAKEWLEKSQLQLVPQTPTQTVIHYDAPDLSARRKRCDSKIATSSKDAKCDNRTGCLCDGRHGCLSKGCKSVTAKLAA